MVETKYSLTLIVATYGTLIAFRCSGHLAKFSSSSFDCHTHILGAIGIGSSFFFLGIHSKSIPLNLRHREALYRLSYRRILCCRMNDSNIITKINKNAIIQLLLVSNRPNML